jgi:hypothetical protein
MASAGSLEKFRAAVHLPGVETDEFSGSFRMSEPRPTSP